MIWKVNTSAVLTGVENVGATPAFRDDPVSDAFTVVGGGVWLALGSQTEERAYVDAKAFEHQVNQRTLRNLRRFSLAALAALFAASLAVGWVIAGRVLAPIAHITSVAREIQARELSRA